MLWFHLFVVTAMGFTLLLPIALVRSSHSFKNQFDCIRLISNATKQRLSEDKFSSKTANRPNVNFSIVIFHSEKQLRSPVIQSNNSSGRKLSHFLGQTKISNFKLFILVDQNIFRFNISMTNILAVKVSQSFQKTFHQFLDVIYLKSRLAVVDYFIKIANHQI